MIFVLDNYDSFTYNLVHLMGSLGAEMVVERNRETSVAAIMAMQPDGILLSPGPSRPYFLLSGKYLFTEQRKGKKL